MEALLEATLQVLGNVGKDRLTTTRVAARAGVSVGTLYQYFPNKSALLHAALRRHLAEVAEAVERACREQKGRTAREMVDALVTTFLREKMKHVRTSMALYAVSSDVDGAKIGQEMGARLQRSIMRMLESCAEPLGTDAGTGAFLLQASLGGVSRGLLESGAPEERFETVRRELIVLGCAYLCAPRPAL